MKIDLMDLLVLIANGNDYDGVTPYAIDLAQEFDCTKDTVLSAINRMVKKGLVKKDGRNTKSKQVKCVVITPYGRKCIAEGEIV